MSTYTQLLYHIIFSTMNRKCSLLEKRQEDLFKYIWGIIRNKKCHLYRINGMEDHIHIATDIRPAIALSDFVKDIKVASHDWIKREKIFPYFPARLCHSGGEAWQ